MKRPELSVIVIAYRMAKQLENTLATLSGTYQQGVEADEYEVLVVENHSDDELSAATVASLPENMRYIKRQDDSNGPIEAMNFAFNEARGEYICLIVDGARMLSPGVIRHTLLAHAMSKHSLVFVPGYHIGEQQQHLNPADYSYAEEQKIMQGIDWRKNGYRLFDVASFSNANKKGFLQPIMECNCMSAHRDAFQAIGYADPRFDLPGGGSINLHMTRQLGMLPESQPVLLVGEGSFHQFHGGVTTQYDAQREATMQTFKAQLDERWPGGFRGLTREPFMLGTLKPEAQVFMRDSLQLYQQRAERLAGLGKPLWPDEDAFSSA